jgi:hypothetical protein
MLLDHLSQGNNQQAAIPANIGLNTTTPRSIAFIDAGIDAPQVVAAGLQSDIKVFLDASKDGITQITETLAQYRDLATVTIISHGNAGELFLGKSLLNQASLGDYADEIQQWQQALSSDADILLGGCRVAAGEVGQTFVQNLSHLTGADIAASDDSTGDSTQGGDWLLEYTTGNIESITPFQETLMATYGGLFAPQSLFTNQTPTIVNTTDGAGSLGDYELGMEFRSTTAGSISAIRYYKAASETGTHVGKIWSSSGQLLTSVTFANETGSGWQQQALTTPLVIQANTTYIVSVNANTHYVTTNNGLASTVTNGDLSAVADGSNGVYNPTPDLFPTESWNNSNYFRDIVFVATASNPNNVTGTANISGTTTQGQILNASVTDPDGLPGTITYQWQQSTNGTTWTNITGATSANFTLTQAQVNNQVRVNAIYTDALGTNENIFSTATTSVANINDPGAVTVTGTTAASNTLSANVTDPDGLTGATITYQWQQSANGAPWANITGATSSTFSLTQAQVGSRVRVNTGYTDTFGANENFFSAPTAVITASAPTQTLFTNQTPTNVNATDGAGSLGDYELGMEFRSNTAGTVGAIRYYKAASETGTHVGKIWSSSGQLLDSVTFTNETASGWQQQALTTPLAIQANTTYIVSVNANTYYVLTSNGLSNTLTNGNLSAVADGSNGVYNETPGLFPLQSYNNSNYFRDIVFASAVANPGNVIGTANISGTATQGQILNASVTDPDGLPGTITYQWQQSSNGTTWTNITGATSANFTLTQAQVNNQVRVNAIYTDALGTNENLFSTATTSVVNVNDPGAVTVTGTTAAGNTLSANVTDPDGLTGATITYQWQQSANGTTWTNITGATSVNFTLTQAQVNNQVRVNAIYTDALGTAEDRVSIATAAITAASTTQTLFTNQTPSQNNLTDGTGSAGDYELGMEFRSNIAGTVNAIRYYKAASESGTHVGKIWSSSGVLLASVTFTNETGSGWQQQALATPLAIQANTTYVVSVNANTHYVTTANGLASTITNGNLSAVADGSNGIYNQTPNLFPTQFWNNSNYFRDIAFAPTPSNPNNVPGTINISGSVTENATLTAAVNDSDGLSGVSISYQWQQSSNNGATWADVVGATTSTFTLGDNQVGKQVRVKANYTDTLGTIENVTSTATVAVANVNDPGLAILKGSATLGQELGVNIVDTDGTPSTINYQWQRLLNGVWTTITGATTRTLTLTNALLNQQVRVLANYVDTLGSNENVTSSGVGIAAQNAIVLENQKTGTTNWRIPSNLQATDEILGFGDATSIDNGQAINFKISLAQAGSYRIDVYRLGYYNGAGGRLVTSATGLNGGPQAGPTLDPTTRLVEYQWNTSYTLQTGADWTSGLYLAKLTDARTGRQNYIQFVVRDDNRPADLGFQESITTAAAYNNFGGYSTYDFNSNGNQRAYKVSFDRPFRYGAAIGSEQFNNTLTWEYNMARWLESQGYDVSYYSNMDVSTNPLQLYSQKTFLSVGHDEYWSMDMFNNVERARDNGTNLAFFSANTAYWRVRFEPSASGQANRTMVAYKDSWALDPVAQANPSEATTRFRSAEINRPENSLLGVMYVGDNGASNIYNGFDLVVTNASDPYFANTGLRNGDRLTGLVGYEWDAVVNNGFTPAGLVILSQSQTQQQGGLPPLPPGTNPNIANSTRYTAASGAKVFASGTIQWSWGLDSDGITINPREDQRLQQVTVNILKDMGSRPTTPDSYIVV